MKFATTLTLAAAVLAAAPAIAKEEAHQLSQGDRQFLQDAAMGNTAEVQMGALGVAKGTTPTIRQFARWMISTHSFANREISTITERLHGEKPPVKVEPKAAKAMGDLQNLKGKDFDKAYLQAMKEDHENDVRKLGDEAKNGQDDLVKTFAANLEPAVKEHLAEIKLLMAETNGGDQGAAAKDANMKAAVGGMSGTPKGDTGQAKAVRQQH